MTSGVNGNSKSLEPWLWEAACSIRGEIEAPKYKDFIIPLVFLKRLNDVFEDELLQISGSRDISLAMVNADHKLVRFYIPKKAQWISIIEQKESLGEYLTTAMRELARENPRLQGVVDLQDFNEATGGMRTISDASLRKLLEILNGKRLGLKDVDADLLGNAYEYLIGKFSEGSGKSAGEFYTPREVADLMGRLLSPEPGEKIYDPACGSGGLLIRTFAAFTKKFGSDSTLDFPKLHGQEINRLTYAMARMNAIIHDVEADIRIGDTIERPAFTNEDGSLVVFDKVTANPMWNQNFEPNQLKRDHYNRFGYGVPPKSSGDWAWIQHMLATTRKRVAVVLDQGALFRGNKEGEIRTKIIQKDLVECVISLPEKLFYNTGAPGAILVFNRVKGDKTQGKILFINASNEFGKHKEIRRLNQLYPEHIERIVRAFESYADERGLAAERSNDDVIKQNGNLNVTLYVSQASEEKQIDIRQVLSELDQTDKQLREVDEKLNSYLKELGYLD
ncbi:MAG: type I restriction-modification system subunit M [Candidatus Thermoplasmatota archaeon]|jgi:type I restriction enzyme M protein|nr:type I restriction-modification system subunit M [Candidatus Thermoplasmatota archaeon]